LRSLYRLPPVLLLIAFASQIVLVRAVALTPWKGGGFGMFSTLDHGAFRRVSVVVEAPNRSEAVEIAPSLEEAEARAVNCPTDRLLNALAAGVAARERRYDRPVASVKLTVWRTQFDPVTLHASDRMLRTFTYRAP
jgi:hypothetical protein